MDFWLYNQIKRPRPERDAGRSYQSPLHSAESAMLLLRRRSLATGKVYVHFKARTSRTMWDSPLPTGCQCRGSWCLALLLPHQLLPRLPSGVRGAASGAGGRAGPGPGTGPTHTGEAPLSRRRCLTPAQPPGTAPGHGSLAPRTGCRGCARPGLLPLRALPLLPLALGRGARQRFALRHEL